ncbi:MAG: thioredoxin family protein, partial [Nannocystaceae bacterium]|nr:thioredoxin family protein [Nannocystaceae bacterium]
TPPQEHSTPPQATTSPPESTPDAVRIVEIDPQAGTLQEQLTAAAARAHADGRPVALELWAGWCAPCKKLDAMLRSGVVADAVRGAVLVRADVDAFDEELTAAGFSAPQIPSLYRLDERGRPRGKPLQGGDWGRRDATAIAAAIGELLAR